MWPTRAYVNISIELDTFADEGSSTMLVLVDTAQRLSRGILWIVFQAVRYLNGLVLMTTAFDAVLLSSSQKRARFLEHGVRNCTCSEY